MKNFTLLILSILLSTTVFDATAKGKKLRLDLEEGSSHRVVNTLDIQYFTDATLTEKQASMKFEMTYKYDVLEKSKEGIHKIKVEITRIKADQNMGPMVVSYDSDSSDASNPMAAGIASQFKHLLNSPITIKVNNLGEVVEKPKKDTTSSPMGGFEFVDMVEQLFMKMPEEEIKEGYTWSQSQAGSNVGAIDAKLNFKVTEISKKTVSLSYNLDEGSIKAPDEALKDMEIKSSGKVLFDRKTGKMLSNTSNQSVKGNGPQGSFFMITTVKQESQD